MPSARAKPLLTEPRMQAAAAGVLAATVLFNPALAIVNGHLHTLSSGIVAGVQGLIMLAAFAIGATSRPAPLRWFALAWGLMLAFVALSLARGVVAPKDLGDVLMIPAFILLGTRIEARLLVRTTTALVVTVATVALWELMNPIGFGAVFKVLDYYVSTRGFDKSQFYAGGDLFVSSTRGGGRFLMNFTGWHRASSLFLEPVSLGNFAGVTALFLATFWDEMDRRTRAIFLACTGIALVACDGRLALGVCVLMAVWLPLARYLPARLSLVYLPAMILLLMAVREAGFLPLSGDTVSGRFRGGLDTLTGLNVAQMLGVGEEAKGSVDAGWAYIVQGQSLFVAIGLWVMIFLSDTGEDTAARRMKHGTALFVVFGLPVSYAILSVKTSALLWTVYGLFYQRAAAARSRKPAARTAAEPRLAPSC